MTSRAVFLVGNGASRTLHKHFLVSQSWNLLALAENKRVEAIGSLDIELLGGLWDGHCD